MGIKLIIGGATPLGAPARVFHDLDEICARIYVEPLVESVREAAKHRKFAAEPAAEVEAKLKKEKEDSPQSIPYALMAYHQTPRLGRRRRARPGYAPPAARRPPRSAGLRRPWAQVRRPGRRRRRVATSARRLRRRRRPRRLRRRAAATSAAAAALRDFEQRAAARRRRVALGASS